MPDRIIRKVSLDKAQYHPGEEVKINIELIENRIIDSVNDTLSIAINDLDHTYSNIELQVKEALPVINISWNVEPELSFCGLGIDVSYINNANIKDIYSTGFDVVEKWSQAPRYGFLASFDPDKKHQDIEQRLRMMKDYHINIVQFYDWMYRHHQLFSSKEEYRDIFNRPLSLKIVKKQIEGCKKSGMKPAAYGAMYGAERKFVEKHPDWIADTRKGTGRNSLLDEHDEYIQIMNIAADCQWREHIVNEYIKAVEEAGFEGIHIDQYGFPKSYYSIVDGKRELKDMGSEFASFIGYTRERMGKETALIFNAVNNWPVEKVAAEPQDVVYIEVWPPHNTFHHLKRLISRARELSNFKKQVILAAYISSLNKKKDIEQRAGERSARLTAAVIFASGGFHLLMGEGAGVLTAAYYPEYRYLSPEYRQVMKDYYDLITRYSKYLFSPDLRDRSEVLSGGVNEEIKLKVEDKEIDFGPNGEKNSIWTIVRENANFKILNLINFIGIDTVQWDSPQYSQPEVQEEIEIEWLLDEDIKNIYWITADGGDIRPGELDFNRIPHSRGEQLKFTVPRLEYWGFVVVQVEKTKKFKEVY